MRLMPGADKARPLSTIAEEYLPQHVLKLPSAYNRFEDIYVARAKGDLEPLSPRDFYLVTQSFIPSDRPIVLINYSTNPPRRFLCAASIQILYSIKDR